MEIIKLFKDSKGFNTFTGKPSDSDCIGWHYDKLKDAMKTATEYFENYTRI